MFRGYRPFGVWFYLKKFLIDCDASIVRAAGAVFVCLFAVLCFNGGHAVAQPSDVVTASHKDALAYCSGSVMRPMALRDDKKILCLDGLIFHEADTSPARELGPDGYFVVRGFGGEATALMKLADMVAAKRTTIIVRDYCFAACANYLLIASVQAIVPKEALVAWGVPRGERNNCLRFRETEVRGAPRLDVYDCAFPLDDPYQNPVLLSKARFYARRMLVRSFKEPPESAAVRRVLKRRFDETGRYPVEMFWTWNPRHYVSLLRTKVSYEAYPQSQSDVDVLLERHQLRERVIYDP